MNRIKELRQSKKLRQSDLAAELQVSQATLSNWESGRHEPDFESLKKMSDYFQVSVDYLLGGIKKEPAPIPSDEQKIDEGQIMAAFWGGDQDLTEEDKKAMWTDVKNFAAFVAQQKKQEKQRND